MSDWNEQGAPNNNLSPKTIRTSNLVGNNPSNSHEFSEELADGGERDDIINKQLKSHQPGMG